MVKLSDGQSVYRIITDKIMGLLKQGTVPWHRPWKETETARNLVSGKAYRGVNRWLLNSLGFKSSYWATFNQISKLGGSIKEGAKGAPIIFWRWVEMEDPDTGDIRQRPFLRYFRVFNLDQVTGIDEPVRSETEVTPFSPLEECERLIKRMPSPPKIEHQRSQACYSPTRDVVNLLDKDSFKSSEDYYSVLFHELAHSTGHESRLNRSTVTDLAPFGSTNYSREELTAEMAAAMVCGVAGIDNRTIDNSAAYIKGWLKKLSDDPKLVVRAASQAEKAADFIRGLQD